MRKYGYVQKIVEDFQNSPELVKVLAMPDKAYSSPNSARCAYRRAIASLGYHITPRVINGDMYLIKIQNPNWTAKNYNKACYSCENRWPSKECSTCENLSSFKERSHEQN